MIFVTLGTHTASFERLLAKMDQLIREGRIKERTVAQIGHTPYIPLGYEHFSFCPRERFQELMAEATAVVTHGGIGTILPAIRLGKTVIAVPRISKYGEHNNDHQRDICLSLAKIGLIHTTEAMDDIPRLLKTPLMPKERLPLRGTLENAIAERLRLQQLAKAAKEGRVLETVDLIAILAGDKPTRHMLAIRLLKEQPTSMVTVTGQCEEIDAAAVPLRRVLNCKKTRTTYEDSMAIKAMAQEMGFRSIAVVTSKLHRRRAALTFEKIFGDSPILVQVVCANEPAPRSIWRIAVEGIEYCRELLKTVYYRVRGRL